ncbi:MAG: hypothetical protein GX657_17215 [Chloroflexi bacterium]|nr:hypothetical protein [Chloroflexota bacterium]
MRTISPALLAAATSRRGRPAVSLTIEDHRSRWARHAAGTASTRRSDLRAGGPGLVRALLRGGEVLVARLADPAAPASWPGAWAAVATDADGSEDVALAAFSPAAFSPAAFSIFYLNLAGQVARVDSADGGATWSAPAACRTWDYTPVRLAADGGACAFSRPGEVRVALTRDDLGGPDWSAEMAVPGLAGLVFCQGLALARDPARPNLYYLAVAADGALLLITYDAAAHACGPAHRLAGGAGGAEAEASCWADPSLTVADDGVYLSAVERLGSADTAHWQHTTVFRGRTWPWLGRVATLDMGQTLPARAALAATGGAVYAAHERNVCRATLWSAASAAHNLAGLPVGGYRLRAGAEGSRLEVTIPNVGGALARPGEPAGGLEALRLGATVLLKRGYRTASGEETVALPPHDVTAVRLGGGALTIIAEDGLALLGRWRSADLCDWAGLTLRALLAALAGAVGVDYADGGEAALGRALARFTLRPSDTAADGVRAVLGLAGAVAACEASGALRARVLASYGPGPAEVGAAGELLRGEFGRALPAETAWRVWGEGVAAATPPAAGEDAMTLGMALLGSLADHRATSEPLAADLAAHRTRLAALASRAETLVVPLRPDLELWDRLRVTAPPHVVPADALRRVLRLGEEYAPQRGVYQTTLLAGWGE